MDSLRLQFDSLCESMIDLSDTFLHLVICCSGHEPGFDGYLLLLGVRVRLFVETGIFKPEHVDEVIVADRGNEFACLVHLAAAKVKQDLGLERMRLPETPENHGQDLVLDHVHRSSVIFRRDVGRLIFGSVDFLDLALLAVLLLFHLVVDRGRTQDQLRVKY